MFNLKRKIFISVLDYYIKNRLKYKIAYFSNKSNAKIEGTPIIKQPSLMIGKGKISYGKNVQLGYYPSPFFYSGYSHIEARTENSLINFGDNININNNLVIIAEKEVKFSNNILIGSNVEIYDSDFHTVSINRWGNKNYKVASVLINDNVWIGSNVKILKGVEIGFNTVISNSSVVTKSFPENVIVGGIPAKIIKKIEN